MSELTLQEAFKSKAKFEELMSKQTIPEFEDIIKQYPHNTVIVKITDLTQNIETFLNAINELGDITPYIVWIVVNEKENIMKVAKFFNRASIKNAGIFVFKASLIDNNLGFNCILKPTISKQNSGGGKAKQIQLEYWKKYFEICDEVGSDMQVTPKPQHWQYIPMGKTGVSIQLSVGTKIPYICVDLAINNNKDTFDKLQSKSTLIEKELGVLDWVNEPNTKSSKIRKTVEYDITDESKVEDAIKAHIKLAEAFKNTFSKYL